MKYHIFTMLLYWYLWNHFLTCLRFLLALAEWVRVHNPSPVPHESGWLYAGSMTEFASYQRPGHHIYARDLAYPHGWNDASGPRPQCFTKIVNGLPYASSTGVYSMVAPSSPFTR